MTCGPTFQLGSYLITMMGSALRFILITGVPQHGLCNVVITMIDQQSNYTEALWMKMLMTIFLGCFSFSSVYWLTNHFYLQFSSLYLKHTRTHTKLDTPLLILVDVLISSMFYKLTKQHVLNSRWAMCVNDLSNWNQRCTLVAPTLWTYKLKTRAQEGLY